MKRFLTMLIMALLLSGCDKSHPEVRYVAVPPGYTVDNTGAVVPVQQPIQPQVQAAPQAYYPQAGALAPQVQAEDHTLRNAAIAAAAGAAGAYAVHQMTKDTKRPNTSVVNAPSYHETVVKQPAPVPVPVAKASTPSATVATPVKAPAPTYQVKQAYTVKQNTPTYTAPPKPQYVVPAAPVQKVAAPSKVTWSSKPTSSKKK